MRQRTPAEAISAVGNLSASVASAVAWAEVPKLLRVAAQQLVAATGGSASTVAGRLQNQYGQRRQGQVQRELASHAFDGFGFHLPDIAEIAAAVHRGIAVDALAPAAGDGYADSVAFPRHRREVADDQQAATVTVVVLAV